FNFTSRHVPVDQRSSSPGATDASPFSNSAMVETLRVAPSEEAHRNKHSNRTLFTMCVYKMQAAEASAYIIDFVHSTHERRDHRRRRQGHAHGQRRQAAHGNRQPPSRGAHLGAL